MTQQRREGPLDPTIGRDIDGNRDPDLRDSTRQDRSKRDDTADNVGEQVSEIESLAVDVFEMLEEHLAEIGASELPEENPLRKLAKRAREEKEALMKDIEDIVTRVLVKYPDLKPYDVMKQARQLLTRQIDHVRTEVEEHRPEHRHVSLEKHWKMTKRKEALMKDIEDIVNRVLVKHTGKGGDN